MGSGPKCQGASTQSKCMCQGENQCCRQLVKVSDHKAETLVKHVRLASPSQALCLWQKRVADSLNSCGKTAGTTKGTMTPNGLRPRDLAPSVNWQQNESVLEPQGQNDSGHKAGSVASQAHGWTDTISCQQCAENVSSDSRRSTTCNPASRVQWPRQTECSSEGSIVGRFSSS